LKTEAGALMPLGGSTASFFARARLKMPMMPFGIS
jgi:hypothetical protein